MRQVIRMMQLSRIGPLGIRLALLVMLSILPAFSSLAQSGNTAAAPDPWAGIEEMVVVGSGEAVLTMIDTSAAIGFDAETLQVEGVDDISDLSAFTPNLEIKTAFAAVNPTIFLRGVGLDDFNSNSSGAVSIFHDGIYKNSPAGQLFGLFDVEGVEVLLGPQPTLTNASAGAILIRSKKPTDELEATLTSTFGNFNLRQFEGALNIPVLPEQLAFRVAFKIQERDGTTRNVCPGIILARPDNADRGNCRFVAPPDGRRVVGPSDGGRDWVNDKDNWAARGLMSYVMPLPGDQEVDWLLSVSGGQNRSLASQFQHVAMSSGAAGLDFRTTDFRGVPATDLFGYSQTVTAGDAYAGEFDRVGPERLDLISASLKGEWSPSDAYKITSLSGFSTNDRETFSNDDGGPRNWQNNDYTDDSWQFSQETEVSWLWSEENDASLGGFFLIEELDSENTFRNDINSGSPVAFVQKFEQDTMLAGVFAKTHFELPALPAWGQFVENFSVDASVRYSWAQKQMNNRTQNNRQGIGLVSNNGLEKDAWSAWVGDAVLSYAFTDEVSTYFKYSRGWKPGHFNANTLRSTQPVSAVEPETVDSLELALRTSFFDGRLKANLTGFSYDYQNLQVFQVTVDSSNVIFRRLINAEEAEIWGVEWDLPAEPIERLVVNFAGGYLSSEYKKFSAQFERNVRLIGQQPILAIVNEDYSGNRLIASPVWSLTGSIEYEILSRIGSFVPRMSFSYRDEVFFDTNEGCGVEGNIPECLLRQGPTWIFNAVLRYATPDGEVEVLGFVRNFLDKEYKVQSFDTTAGSGFVLDAYGDPRTFGLAVTLHFR